VNGAAGALRHEPATGESPRVRLLNWAHTASPDLSKRERLTPEAAQLLSSEVAEAQPGSKKQEQSRKPGDAAPHARRLLTQSAARPAPMMLRSEMPMPAGTVHGR
jgi:hypothetical protein